jgi:hypothetical protein
MKLGERRWAVGVQAPFDMPAEALDLMGTKVMLDAELFESECAAVHHQARAAYRDPRGCYPS